jgi:hypothetical protein
LRAPRLSPTQGGVTLELQSVHFPDGAAIWLEDAVSPVALTLVGCKFGAATIAAPRIAVVGPSSRLTVFSTTFDGAVNTAADSWTPFMTTGKGYGGAIMVDGPALTVSGSTFTGCKAEVGGAVAVRANTPTKVLIEGSTFVNCAAATTQRLYELQDFGEVGAGGAIFTSGFRKAVVAVNTCVFSGCSAKQLDLNAASSASGGAIAVARGDELSVAGSKFAFNKAERGGGAIFGSGTGTRVSITGSTFVNNQLKQGQGQQGLQEERGGTALRIEGTGEEAAVQGCTFLWGTEAWPVVYLRAMGAPIVTFDRCTWDGGVVAPTPPDEAADNNRPSAGLTLDYAQALVTR